MDESAVTEYITQTFPEVETTTNFGYTFFYRTDRTLPFAQFISADDEYDRRSHLAGCLPLSKQDTMNIPFAVSVANRLNFTKFLRIAIDGSTPPRLIRRIAAEARLAKDEDFVHPPQACVGYYVADVNQVCVGRNFGRGHVDRNLSTKLESASRD